MKEGGDKGEVVLTGQDRRGATGPTGCLEMRGTIRGHKETGWGYFPSIWEYRDMS